MKRKKIALLVGQVQEQYQTEFTKGLLKSAFEQDMDVCVFSTYQRRPETDTEGVGESSVFSAIQYDEFDALIVLPDTIQNKGLIINMEKDFEAFKGPVLYVDKETDKFPHITQKNRRPIYRVTEHLITQHGYKTIGFINGFKDHPHSIEREEGFRQCMAEYGLPVQEKWVLYGDYWYQGGEKAALDLLALGDDMPRAIVCANDYMAIAAAGIFEKNGKHVPEDIAIISYDSVEAGKSAPQPITSIPLADYSYGAYAVDCIQKLLQGEEIEEFVSVEPFFIGSSCGCSVQNVAANKITRGYWRADQMDVNHYIRMSRLTEEFVLQTTFKNLMDSVQTYTYSIREFESFRICLNDSWKNVDKDIRSVKTREGLSNEMLHVLQCGRSGEGADKIDYEETFPISIMSPSLEQECDYPRAFFFTPLSYEDSVFGYATISYGNEVRCIDNHYILWLRSLSVGLENFFRNEYTRQTNGGLAKAEIYDNLTGMYNYEGFIKHARPMVERGKLETLKTVVIAIDISGLEQINASFGRKGGDQAIYALSQIIFDAADEGAMCCRLGNDEFIMASLLEESDHTSVNEIYKRINKGLEAYNNNTKNKYKINIHLGYAAYNVLNVAHMEDLVNQAVSDKNGKKASEQRAKNEVELTPDEEQKLLLVKQILDENLFHYHFQPIVNAKDGSIYAYEALMRSATETFVSPLEIIRFATHLKRLTSVEAATFFNVLDNIEGKKHLFEGKKVFINSIPGHQVVGEEARILSKRLQKNADSIVIELTEQTEADEDTMSYMRKRFDAIGVETAVDDYGTGFSNIVNLLRYTPNYVKVDRMLLTGIQDNRQKQHFVKDIVLFAKENNFKVLAVGLETTEELKTVIELGVDLIQGYYTARPNAEVIQAIDSKIVEEIITYNTVG